MSSIQNLKHKLEAVKQGANTLEAQLGKAIEELPIANKEKGAFQQKLEQEASVTSLKRSK
jgi:hypothetical protein